MSDKRSDAAAFGADLAAELQSVTLEEFRLTEARYETDAQLGRELLFLLSKAEWSRRTTELLDVSRVAAVETRVTVDVDPGNIAHEALRSVDRPAAAAAVHAAERAGRRRAAGRSAHPYLVVDDGSREGFVRLLAGAQGDVPGRGRELLRRAPDALLSRGGPEPAGRAAPPPNLVGLLRGSAADLAATFLVFRDEPDDAWISSADSTVLPLDVRPGQLAPMEPPDWVLDVMVGFDPALAAAPVQEHPLATIAYAAELAGFTVLNVQLPAPPLEDAWSRQWLRARIGVPPRRADPLDRLTLFFDRLHRMREHGLRVHLREVPPTESLDATQAAREDPFDAPPGLLVPVGSAPEKTGDLVTADEVLAAPGPDARRLVVCAPPNPGLLAGVLSALAVSGEIAALDGAVTGILNGTAVLLLTCRAAHHGPLAELITGHPMLSGWPVTVTELPAPAATNGRRPDTSPALLQVRVYIADRPGVLQALAGALGREIGKEATGQPVPVDVLYSLVPVVDGRSVSGRLLVRLPPHRDGNPGWESVHWTAVERRVVRAVWPNRGRPGDTAIGLDLVRRPKWLPSRPEPTG